VPLAGDKKTIQKLNLNLCSVFSKKNQTSFLKIWLDYHQYKFNIISINPRFNNHCFFPWNLFQFGLLHLAQAIGDCLLCLFLEIQIWPQTSHLKPWICIIAIIIIYPHEISINTTIRYIFRRRLDTWLTLYYYSTCPAKRTAYMFLPGYAAKLSR
jgi:hypothetical protein